ncbi:MAG: thioredoxin [Oscillospiraceae bacterium]|nr:thioredoxin [Oscillospiraceae bacterium]
MAVIHADNPQAFTDEVLNASGKVLVDFWANWCGPCRMMAPVLEELSRNYPNVKVVKTDVDQMQETAAQFGISSIPAFLLFENGKVTQQAIGAMPAEMLAAKLGIR